MNKYIIYLIVLITILTGCTNEPTFKINDSDKILTGKITEIHIQIGDIAKIDLNNKRNLVIRGDYKILDKIRVNDEISYVKQNDIYIIKKIN